MTTRDRIEIIVKRMRNIVAFYAEEHKRLERIIDELDDLMSEDHEGGSKDGHKHRQD